MKIFLKAVLVMYVFPFTISGGWAQKVSPEFADPEARFFYVIRNNINLHKSPGMRTGIVARADSGEICRYEYEIGEWILVRFPDSRQGFVHVSMLAPCPVRSDAASPGRYAEPAGQDGAGGIYFEAGTAGGRGGSSGVWKWAALCSLALNLIMGFLFIKKWYEERRCAGSYDKLRELAKIEESKETLKRELYLTTCQNRRLENQLARLRGEGDKK